MVFKKFAELIMVEQTLFALPFAYIGMLFAGRASVLQWVLVTLALVSARTAGMCFNRVIDADIDAKNPRTKGRTIPRGAMSKREVWIYSTIFSLILIVSSYFLNMICFYLSFVAVGLLFTYSYFKRFSASSHYYLGVVEAAAPIGGYLAIKGEFDLVMLLLGAAILFWIAGLDIIYAIQDMEFDRKEKLHSIPAKFGRGLAYIFSASSYLISIAALVGAGHFAGMSYPYWISVAAVALIFFVQQIYGRGSDIQKAVGKIFYLNRFVSPAILIGIILDVYFF